MGEPYVKSTPLGERFIAPASEVFSGAAAYSQNSFTAVAGYRSYSWVNSLSGVKRPTWRRDVRNHENATTALNAQMRAISATPAYGYGQGNVNTIPTPAGRRKTLYRGVFCDPGYIASAAGVPSNQAASQAAGQFYQKASQAISGFKSQVFAGESGEARSMMLARSRRILSSIPGHQDSVKRRWYGKGSRRARLKRLADSWLELQYGWLPLFSDIESARKVLKYPAPQYKFVRGQGSQSSESVISEAKSGAPNCTFWVRHVEYMKSTVMYYGLVRSSLSPSGGSASRDFGLTLREFTPTLWELLPWSFLVDYFTNIGDVINAVSYASADYMWSSKTSISTRTFTSSTYGWELVGTSTFPSEREINVSPDRFRSTAKQVLRTPIDVVPVPGITFQVPKPKQIINMAALAVSKRLRLFDIVTNR